MVRSDIRALAGEAMASGASDNRELAVAIRLTSDGFRSHLDDSLVVDFRHPLSAQMGTGGRPIGGDVWFAAYGGEVRMLTEAGETRFEHAEPSLIEPHWSQYVDARMRLLGGDP